jgi:hypothetical protein
MIEKETILSRLRKMIAHEESARTIGSIKEAEVFAEKITALLARHKLSMSEVEFFEHVEAEPVGREVFIPVEHGLKRSHQRVWWQEYLAGTVARANQCRIFVRGRSNVVTFVGRTTDRQVTAYQYAMLVRTIARESERAYQEAYRKGEQGRRFKASFIQGALMSISDRLRAVEKVVRSEADSEALVRVDTTKQDVNDYMKEVGSRSISGLSSQGGSSLSGYEAGLSFGQGVNLGGKSHGSIGKGSKGIRGK